VGVGRRWATQQINDAYVVLLQAQFQRFCRDLHTEAVFILAQHAGPPPIQSLFRISATRNRKLDQGNAQPANIGADFSLLALEIWPRLRRRPQNRRRQTRLEQLNVWRNAIAHQDFALSREASRKVERTGRNLKSIRIWRSACDGLAAEMDAAVGDHLQALLGRPIW
jgi:hypothetical protein